MQISTKTKWIMTTSEDGCVVIVNEERKTSQTDVIISSDCLDQNVKNRKFTKHATLRHKDKPVYVLTSDLQKFL